MKRHGSLLVFKADTSKKMIDFALAQLIPILDDSNFIGDDGKLTPYRIEEYDDEWGGPTFYLP